MALPPGHLDQLSRRAAAERVQAKPGSPSNEDSDSKSSLLGFPGFACTLAVLEESWSRWTGG